MRGNKMIPAHVEEKLRMFREETYEILRDKEQTVLKEKAQDGKVNLICTAQGELLVFPLPEKHVFPYLDGEQKGTKACADKFVFKLDEESGAWDLHIVEFKKTIDTSVIGKSQWQFTMGIYNARAIAGFLGMKMKNVYLYSGFRNDKLAGKQSLIALKVNNNKEAITKIRQWTEDRYELRVDGANKTFTHQKIQLDSEGNGSILI